MLAKDSLIRLHGHQYHYGCLTYRPRQAKDRGAAAGGAVKPERGAPSARSTRTDVANAVE